MTGLLSGSYARDGVPAGPRVARSGGRLPEQLVVLSGPAEMRSD